MLTPRWDWLGTPRRLRGGSGRRERLIALDRDPEAMELATARLDELREELGREMPTVKLVPKAFSRQRTRSNREA